ncbi:tetratricopeptide repeat protein [Chryseobacterium sp. RU33C]|uniref:tetratricopeptide repeat protein n=1 Tax=Chryseobacterium sp. RU33C TaxID=1907398 RepID=UPI000954DDD7|nr:hypothetical protein [Chryseobacterium sp. RU33C]SIR65845.1 hypothetical protein SAMN05880573_1329 [Chryseobacterium sp. RU33C]
MLNRSKYYIFITKFSFLFAILFYGIFFAQEHKIKKEVDSLAKVAEQFYLNYDIRKLLLVSHKILLKSEKINYERGLILGNFYIAATLYDVEKYGESIRYIKKSMSYSKLFDQDPELGYRNYALLAGNYKDLELYSLAIKSLQKSLKLIQNTNRIKDHIVSEASVNGFLSEIYAKVGKKDSMYYYLIQEKKIFDKIENSDIYFEKAVFFRAFGDYYLSEKKVDSAKYYYEKSIVISKKINSPEFIDAFMGLAKLNTVQGKYNEALRYYHTILNENKKNSLQWHLSEVYSNLEYIYTQLGNTEKATFFRNLFNETKYNQNKSKEKERSFVIDETIKFEKEKLQHENDQNKKYTYIAITIINVFLFIGVFIIVKRKRKQLISKSDTIINQKEIERQKLQKKLNEAFEEVIELARSNSPEFFTRFREVYPEVVDKLIGIYPKLRVSELTLCAFIFLGFTTKDIASITFTSIHTVKGRKNSLRKKLNIPVDDATEMWIKTLGG